MYRKYDYLCEEARKIREEVFVKEQGFKDEFDSIDDKAFHLVFFDRNNAYGVCRYFKDDNGEYVIGRVAVVKSYRKKHLGSYIINTAEENIILDGGKRVFLSAQVQAKDFYKRNGYTEYGEVYLDEYCPHIHMKKDLIKYKF